MSEDINVHIAELLFFFILPRVTPSEEMNNLMIQMRHTAHELRVTLDHVLQGGEAGVAPPTADEPISFLAEPEAQMRAASNVSDVSVTIKETYLKEKIAFFFLLR